MPDRYAFTNPQDNENSWFQIGTINVGTAILGSLIGLAALFANAISNGANGFASLVSLSTSDIQNGQVWRFVTWPLANLENPFWALLSVVIFGLIGSQIEALMGKEKFLSFIAVSITVPAVIATVVGLVTGTADADIIAGFSNLTLALFIGFAVMVPFAQFFLRIPAWGFGAGFVIFSLLTSIASDRTLDVYFILALTITVFAFISSTGLAHEIFANVSAAKGGSRSKPVGGHLKSVAPPVDENEMNSLLDKISTSGIKSLSKQEKKRLKELSENLKDS